MGGDVLPRLLAGVDHMGAGDHRASAAVQGKMLKRLQTLCR